MFSKNTPYGSKTQKFCGKTAPKNWDYLILDSFVQQLFKRLHKELFKTNLKKIATKIATPQGADTYMLCKNGQNVF